MISIAADLGNISKMHLILLVVFPPLAYVY